MTKVENLAKFDKIGRRVLTSIPNQYFISFYSNQKKKLIKQFADDYVNFSVKNIHTPQIKLWDIDFKVPVFNSAGMFKYSEGYYTCAMQGAGAWLAGTYTTKRRIGNFKKGVLHPFLPLPNSDIAVNWMGLPNEGIEVAAKKISELEKFNNTPMGVSISADPGNNPELILADLVEGMKLLDKANVDFIELNESCPNVSEGHSLSNDKLDESLVARMEYISENFLKYRSRNLPLILKLSNDTSSELIPLFIDIAIELGFDGLNLGNTSTNYTATKEFLTEKERKMFNYFTNVYGGGVSGKSLKENSKKLCKLASEYLQNKNLKKEFHIIRTGGIDSAEDILESKKVGVLLNQWYTGYFKNFGKYGHSIYSEISKQLV